MSIHDELEVIIIGAGGHGSELASYIQDLAAQGAKVHLRGFVDEHKAQGPWGTREILGDFKALGAFLRRHQDTIVHYVTAVGDNRVRKQLVQKVDSLNAPHLVPWTLHHPCASVGCEVVIGVGTCLAPGSIITTRVKIGKHCILNVRASVSHDCAISDFVNINPGAVVCGNVEIGEGVYIGAGATVINNISIGPWSIIGAGAVVIDNIPAYVTAVGVPAKVINRSTALTF